MLLAAALTAPAARTKILTESVQWSMELLTLRCLDQTWYLLRSSHPGRNTVFSERLARESRHKRAKAGAVLYKARLKCDVVGPGIATGFEDVRVAVASFALELGPLSDATLCAAPPPSVQSVCLPERHHDPPRTNRLGLCQACRAVAKMRLSAAPPGKSGGRPRS